MPLQIGEVARTLGISASTLRLWDERGLVRPLRTAGGARRYREEDLPLLRRILYLRRVEGLGLHDISSVLANETIPRSPAVPNEDRNRKVGEQLRERRLASGYTLKQASEATGLSTSFLSAVERGVTGASIATLHKLTALYGITISDLLLSGRRDRRLVPACERPQLAGSWSGVKIEQLAVGAYQMEPHLFEVQPHAESGGAYEHVGEEFIFVLRGAFEVFLADDERYALKPGDCLYFPSSLPHRWRNPGAEVAVLLWVNTPPTF